MRAVTNRSRYLRGTSRSSNIHPAEFTAREAMIPILMQGTYVFERLTPIEQMLLVMLDV
jgi:hypothetical protein